MKRFAVLALLIVLILTIASATGAQSKDYAINLQSRTFTPSAEKSRTAAPVKDTTWYGLIQLDHIPTEQERQQLTDSGVHLLQYIPNYTWVAKFSANGTYTRSNLVRWTGALQPTDKISGALLDSAETARSSTTIVRVLTWDGNAAGLEAFGTVSADKISDGYLLELPTSGLQTVANHENVMWIEAYDEPVQLNKEIIQLTQADVVQSVPYSLSGNNIKVGIFDFDPMDEHSDMQGRVSVEPSFTSDPQNHATIMAGTVAAGGINHPGMAPNAQLTAYKFWNTDAIANKEMDISSQAWGATSCINIGTYNSSSSNYDALNTMPIVFAAGNSQASCSDPNGFHTLLTGPQASKNIISVGATDDSGILAAFSSKGPLADGRIGPTLVAPGVNIMSTCVDNTYCAGSGTSFAAPAVAGAIALMLEQFRADNPDGADPLPSSHRAALVNSAIDRGNPGPDYGYGYGILNVLGAIENLATVRERSLTNGKTHTYELVLEPGRSELRLTLAWDDVPASPYATKAIINDLDLKIIDPAGNVHYPFVLDANNPSNNAGRGVDTLNVTEQVLISAPAAGEYTVEVTGSTIPASTQSYSLAGLVSSTPTGVALSTQTVGSADTTLSLTIIYIAMLLMIAMTGWVVMDTRRNGY